MSLLFRAEYLHAVPTTYLGRYGLVQDNDEMKTSYLGWGGGNLSELN